MVISWNQGSATLLTPAISFSAILYYERILGCQTATRSGNGFAVNSEP